MCTATVIKDRQAGTLRSSYNSCPSAGERVQVTVAGIDCHYQDFCIYLF